MIGWDGRQVTLLLRQFDKPLGLAASENRLALATRHDVVVLANAPLPGMIFSKSSPADTMPFIYRGRAITRAI